MLSGSSKILKAEHDMTTLSPCYLHLDKDHSCSNRTPILNGSIATIKGFPGITVYSASKAAVRSFARNLANELRDRRIRVNTLSPGYTDTPLLEQWQQGDALTQLKESFAKDVPLGRMGTPDDIAKAASFLASDEASYVNGIELFVDRGVAQI
jgi:NAD(P)-dependent dehydrogenase (short-subunit alcohol dehydrogenase family)